jgi:SAM-dependent methyltransferase
MHRANRFATLDSQANRGALNEILNYEALAESLRKSDAPSYYGLTAVQRMHREAIRPYANDILRFLSHRGAACVVEKYVARVGGLRSLQSEFERTGQYVAESSKHVQPIDTEQYNLALLLSFICTSHRFDILRCLVSFLRTRCQAPMELLSVGYGTGYELKLALEEAPGWRIVAFDNSPDSYKYASQLLRFFGHPIDCLHQDVFSFECHDGVVARSERFGKVILCELLEHLDDPKAALRSVRSVLHREGLLFCTMAVNIAQEDHVYVYRSADQARADVLECGFEIVQEMLAPVVILPFSESKRAQLFKKGNYICIARPK